MSRHWVHGLSYPVTRPPDAHDSQKHLAEVEQRLLGLAHALGFTPELQLHLKASSSKSQHRVGAEYAM